MNRVLGTLRRIPCYGELIPCSRESLSLFWSNCFPVPPHREFPGVDPASYWIRTGFRDGFSRKTAESEEIRCYFPVTGPSGPSKDPPMGRPSDRVMREKCPSGTQRRRGSV